MNDLKKLEYSYWLGLDESEAERVSAAKTGRVKLAELLIDVIHIERPYYVRLLKNTSIVGSCQKVNYTLEVKESPYITKCQHVSPAQLRIFMEPNSKREFFSEREYFYGTDFMPRLRRQSLSQRIKSRLRKLFQVPARKQATGGVENAERE